MDAVIAGKRRQAHVGDDEPLRRHAVIVAAAGALGRGRHHIDAGLQVAERLIDREPSRPGSASMRSRVRPTRLLRRARRPRLESW